MSDPEYVIVDEPVPLVRRLTLNRPEKKNALGNALRTQLFGLLREADQSREVSVVVIRGAGDSFSAGYDLAQDPDEEFPRPVARQHDGFWPRHLVDGWFEMWDMTIPIIGQVHGYCLAGGTELAMACDLVYVAEDAKVGYPPVRMMSPPDTVWQPWLLGLRQSMEAMLTGDAMDGIEAARQGMATRAYPADQLEAEVLTMAERIAKVPPELLAANKRAVHRQMEAMGIRQGLRSTTDLQALTFHQPAPKAYMRQFAEKGVSEALSERDREFGDYRERDS